MSTDGAERAFPGNYIHTDEKGHYPMYSNGMTLRDYYAGQAIAGIMANLRYHHESYYEVVDQAWAIADKMIERRNE